MIISSLRNNVSGRSLKPDSAILIRRHRDYSPHRRIIRQYRDAHPLCQHCLYHQRLSGTTQIHHVKRIADGGYTTDENLFAVCDSCHEIVDNLPISLQLEMKRVTDIQNEAR